MSQASSKVTWCLEKAKKEVTAGHKHRGLVQGKPDQKIALAHIDKAERNLQVLNYLHDGGFDDWAVSAGFYSLYHCFLAILARYGYDSRNQECTIAAIEQLMEEKKFDLNREFLSAFKQFDTQDQQEATVIELRELFQYGIKVKVQSRQLENVVRLCKNGLNKTRNIIS